MMRNVVSKKNRVCGRLHRFCRAEDGSAIVEFAFLAPILIFLMLGAITAFDSVRGIRYLENATTTAADLSTRLASMDSNMETAIFNTVEALLGKYATRNDYHLTITSVANPLNSGNSNPIVVWSSGTDPAQELKTEDLAGITLPAIPNGEGVILVSSEMTHNPAFLIKNFNRTFKFENSVIRRPRFVNEVCYAVDKNDFVCSDDV
ncbi:MAG: TadE/TadG family type IV pilus assembly protein [Pseudomonadota bacterium]